MDVIYKNFFEKVENLLIKICWFISTYNALFEIISNLYFIIQ